MWMCIKLKKVVLFYWIIILFIHHSYVYSNSSKRKKIFTFAQVASVLDVAVVAHKPHHTELFLQLTGNDYILEEGERQIVCILCIGFLILHFFHVLIMLNFAFSCLKYLNKKCGKSFNKKIIWIKTITTIIIMISLSWYQWFAHSMYLTYVW